MLGRRWARRAAWALAATALAAAARADDLVPWQPQKKAAPPSSTAREPAAEPASASRPTWQEDGPAFSARLTQALEQVRRAGRYSVVSVSGLAPAPGRAVALLAIPMSLRVTGPKPACYLYGSLNHLDLTADLSALPRATLRRLLDVEGDADFHVLLLEGVLSLAPDDVHPDAQAPVLLVRSLLDLGAIPSGAPQRVDDMMRSP